MAEALDPRIGTVLAGFRIEALLGRGGMGVVYLAEQLKFGRKVALKVLSPELADDVDFRQRFELEWRTAAALDHPSIVPIFDAGEADGLLYIAMRYVEGVDLNALIATHARLDIARAIAIVDQVGAALDAAHGHGLVHRDVKPSNILISRPGLRGEHAYLTDFGVAKTTRTRGLTKAGYFVGSVDYAPPEQIEGRAVDGRADVYSLGCVFYQCLAGALPYEKDSDVAMLYAHLLEPIPRLSARRSDLPPELDVVIRTTLAKSSEDRYQTCEGFVDAARAAVGMEKPTTGLSPTLTGESRQDAEEERTGVPGEERTMATPAPLQSPEASVRTQAAPPAGESGPPSGDSPEPPGRRPWWRSRGALIAALAVGLGAAGAGAAIALSGGSETTPQAQSAATSLATATSSTGGTAGTDPQTDAATASAEGDPTQGKEVFLAAGCASCHTLADAESTGTVGPNLDEAAPSFDSVVQRVTEGGGGMPSFEDSLSEQQIADVAAYVSQVAASEQETTADQATARPRLGLAEAMTCGRKTSLQGNVDRGHRYG